VISRPTSLRRNTHPRPNAHTVLLPARQHHHGHVREPHQGRHDAIDDLAGARVVREQQAQAAVDDAEGDEGAAEPDVNGGPEGAARGADVQEVVRKAQHRLEDKERDDDDADDGMVRVELWVKRQMRSNGR